MGLRCRSAGCSQVLARCRCKKGLRRHWQADVWVHAPGETHLRRKWVTSDRPMTAKEAGVWYGSLQHDATLPAEQRRIIPPPPESPQAQRLFRAASDQLLRELNAEVTAGQMRVTTYDNHVGHCVNHILKEFGERPLNEIDVAAVKAFRTKLMTEKKLRSRTQRAILDTLGMIFGAAMDNGWTDSNPMWRLREAGRRRGIRPKSDARKPIALTAAELLLLEEVTRGRPLRLPWLLMAFAGMRRGEALGLQRRDFDSAAETLRIERILTHYEVTTPKANSGREVPVPAWLAEEIRAHLKTKQVVAIAGDDWIFTTPEGAPLHNNMERAWSSARKALGKKIADPARKAELAHLRMHDLRHSFATALAEQRVEPTARQALLGHASLQMTSHYTHPSAAAKRAAAAALPIPDRCVTAASGTVE